MRACGPSLDGNLFRDQLIGVLVVSLRARSTFRVLLSFDTTITPSYPRRFLVRLPSAACSVLILTYADHVGLIMFYQHPPHVDTTSC